MKRYVEDTALMDRRLKVWNSFMSIPSARGRFRKRKPLDCGRTRCALCHREKIYHRPGRARMRAEDEAAYAIAEAVK